MKRRIVFLIIFLLVATVTKEALADGTAGTASVRIGGGGGGGVAPLSYPLFSLYNMNPDIFSDFVTFVFGMTLSMDIVLQYNNTKGDAVIVETKIVVPKLNMTIQIIRNIGTHDNVIIHQKIPVLLFGDNDDVYQYNVTSKYYVNGATEPSKIDTESGVIPFQGEFRIYWIIIIVSIGAGVAVAAIVVVTLGFRIIGAVNHEPEKIRKAKKESSGSIQKWFS